ncbi:MAG: phosphoserine aminotransferase, partial [Alphaproteobacteria bacterium]|nr:phosphoserine aminotransferase [Alphaproteobacteria bacterium]
VGETINTPSMLAVEDCYDALKWVESIGGLRETIARCRRNYDAIAAWVDKTAWVDFLAVSEEIASTTSVCLTIADEWFASLPADEQLPFVKVMIKPLDADGVAYDIASYRDAPAGLRIWCGATVETADVEALLPWLDWAYAKAKAENGAKAA